MLILVLILSNVLLAVFFRLLPKYGISNLKAIIINYFTCFCLGSLMIGEWPLKQEHVDSDWFIYALFLSICFIIFFNINALTIQRVGMIITSIFQKLSLVFPVLMGVLLFHESLNTANKMALPITFAAIVLSNLPNRKYQETVDAMKKYWYLPVLVFAGSGLIEVSLFYAQETGKIGDHGMQFTSCLFGFAGLWGLTFLAALKKLRFSPREILAGIMIGIPNFFSIYLLIRGLELGWKGAILFPVNNVGVIFFTAVVAILFFHEKLSKANYLGLILALTAVVLFAIE